MKTLLITLFVVSLSLALPSSVVELPNLGKIHGSFQKSLTGRTFHSFEGIPYAQPPVGQNRFKAPSPVQPWSGIWEAQTVYKCMQYKQNTPPGHDYVIGDEDCLYLNIYSPNLAQTANLDVVVYIHGGAFMWNWGALFGPKYLLDKDVVFVNFNYRLGPLGFLSTEDETIPGNFGMRDQIMALNFIQKHIKNFGGNPNSITIVGMSAGGASVHFHYLSPKSRGLFHRGISQSGTTLEPWVLMEKPLEKAKKLASLIGCPTQEMTVMASCLRSRPPRAIVAAVEKFQVWLYNPFSPFGLVVDSWSSEPVLPQHPYQLIKSKQVYDVPWIASYTNSEGLYPASDIYVDEKYIDDVETRWNELVPYILDYNYTVDPKLHDQVSEQIRRHYLGDKKVSKSTFQDLISVISDRIFVIGIQKTARLQASVTKSDVWSYLFTYRGAHSFSEAISGSKDDLGASHGDDTIYIFNTDEVDAATTEQDKEMIRFLVNLVTSYAKTGEPKVGIEWPKVSKNLDDQYVYLQIDSPKKLSVGKGISENTQFWDSLPIIENEKLFVDMKDEL